jgi:hypothetical protein
MERFPMNVEAIVYAALPTSFSFASDAVVIAGCTDRQQSAHC